MEHESKDLKQKSPANTDEDSTSGSSVFPASSEELEEPLEKRSKTAKNQKSESSDEETTATTTTTTTSTPTSSSGGSPQQDDLENSKIVLRCFGRIPIFVVEQHNHVHEIVQRCVRSKHLQENNTIVHFDSHPGIAIPSEIPASACKAQAILTGLSHDDWIMPSCYAGIFNRVVWIKNYWCQQIPLGQYNFKVGHKDDKISVNCSLDYFLSKGNYCSTSDLKGAKNLEVHVLSGEEYPNRQILLPPPNASRYILDIDLDFFSCTNPYREIYKTANCFIALREIFDSGSAIKPNTYAISDKKERQLEALRGIFEYLEKHRNLIGINKPPTDIVSKEAFNDIEELAQTLLRKYSDLTIDWIKIFNAGCSIDSILYPHNRSYNFDRQNYFEKFEAFLEKLPYPPLLITVCKSSENNYCPREQVQRLEIQLLLLLKKFFGESKVVPITENTKWDVMDL